MFVSRQLAMSGCLAGCLAGVFAGSLCHRQERQSLLPGWLAGRFPVVGACFRAGLPQPAVCSVRSARRSGGGYVRRAACSACPRGAVRFRPARRRTEQAADAGSVRSGLGAAALGRACGVAGGRAGIETCGRPLWRCTSARCPPLCAISRGRGIALPSKLHVCDPACSRSAAGGGGSADCISPDCGLACLPVLASRRLRWPWVSGGQPLPACGVALLSARGNAQQTGTFGTQAWAEAVCATDGGWPARAASMACHSACDVERSARDLFDGRPSSPSPPPPVGSLRTSVQNPREVQCGTEFFFFHCQPEKQHLCGTVKHIVPVAGPPVVRNGCSAAFQSSHSR